MREKEYKQQPAVKRDSNSIRREILRTSCERWLEGIKLYHEDSKKISEGNNQL